MDLQQHIEQLQALESIRRLKHRYLNACDMKQVDDIRACFAEGAVLIDYGPLGTFHDRDSFIRLFQDLACHARVIDLHHGSNEEIELLDADHARGLWALYYFNIDRETGATRQLGGQYHDRYQRIDGQWKIVATRAVLHSHTSGQGPATTTGEA